MTLNDAQFTPVAPESLALNAPVSSSLLTPILQNANWLYRIATNEPWPHDQNESDGHDHAGRGPAIPLWRAVDIGEPANPFQNGSSERLLFTRQHAGASLSYDLWTTASPSPTVASSPAGGGYLLWLSGDQSSALAGAVWITLEDASTPGRYLVKRALFDPDRNATRVQLYTPLPAAPSAGSVVRGWAERGEADLPLFLPTGADALLLAFYAAVRHSISSDSGETAVPTSGDPELGWIWRARLGCGELRSPWQRMMSSDSLSREWRLLSFDVRPLQPEQTHVFFVETEVNPYFAALVPLALRPDDAALWFDHWSTRLRPKALAAFIRTAS